MVAYFNLLRSNPGNPATGVSGMAPSDGHTNNVEWHHGCQHEGEGVPIKPKPQGQVETRPEHMCAKKHNLGHEELCVVTRPGGIRFEWLGAWLGLSH